MALTLMVFPLTPLIVVDLEKELPIWLTVSPPVIETTLPPATMEPGLLMIVAMTMFGAIVICGVIAKFNGPELVDAAAAAPENPAAITNAIMKTPNNFFIFLPPFICVTLCKIYITNCIMLIL